jgi:hypothetical protein
MGAGMKRIRSSISLIATAHLAALLAGCSNGPSPLTTASLLPGSAPKPAQTDPATDRALHAGATSARAAHCGYNFDPARVRTAYLAYEATQDGSAEKLAKLEKTFDYTRQSIQSRLEKPHEYCDDARTAKIKEDLTKLLAGDFTPPPTKAEANLLDMWERGANKRPWKPEDAFPNSSDTR